MTQFQRVATCEKIRAASLRPVIRQVLEGFPCVILGCHAEHGSESIHDQVAAWVETQRSARTTSRPRQSNDHAVADSKNGAVVRKHLGEAPRPHPWAAQVNACGAQALNPYVNVSRPCFFPETRTEANGADARARPGQEDAR